jgi:hypothetical protein
MHMTRATALTWASAEEKRPAVSVIKCDVRRNWQLRRTLLPGRPPKI